MEAESLILIAGPVLLAANLTFCGWMANRVLELSRGQAEINVKLDEVVDLGRQIENLNQRLLAVEQKVLTLHQRGGFNWMGGAT